jgi:DUF971 family protein
VSSLPTPGENAVVQPDGVGQTGSVRAADIQQIGTELAIKWADGSESFVTLEKLRRACPCAGCKGEMDVMGNLYKGPEIALKPESFILRSLAQVGTYAIQPVWSDGHSSGIYSYDYLKRIAEA